MQTYLAQRFPLPSPLGCDWPPHFGSWRESSLRFSADLRQCRRNLLLLFGSRHTHIQQVDLDLRLFGGCTGLLRRELRILSTAEF